jgi:hypothetical protein
MLTQSESAIAIAIHAIRKQSRHNAHVYGLANRLGNSIL